MTKYTHTGLVTRSDTKTTERIELRETPKCWINGFHSWRKSSKEPRVRILRGWDQPYYLTLDLSSIQPMAAEDLKKPLMDAYNEAVRALNQAVRDLDAFEAEHGR